MNTATKLSPLQLELLKIYSFNPSEKELLEIKAVLANYFAERFTSKIDQAVKEKNLTQKDFDSWLNDENQ